MHTHILVMPIIPSPRGRIFLTMVQPDVPLWRFLSRYGIALSITYWRPPSVHLYPMNCCEPA
ncbi:hypothetical protein EI94DRAFT_1712443 [Lactarius quietus]|nr:hypothetical protein EI94DRAFT_1712443 [Lactarius quietus]